MRKLKPRGMWESEMQQLVWDTYAVQYLWVNLGFSVDDCFVACRFVTNAEPPGLYACAILRAQGLEFLFWLRHLHPSDEKRFEREWLRFAHDLPGVDHSIRNLRVAASLVIGSFHLITQKMVDKGFRIPEELRRKFSEPIAGTTAYAAPPPGDDGGSAPPVTSPGGSA